MKILLTTLAFCFVFSVTLTGQTTPEMPEAPQAAEAPQAPQAPQAPDVKVPNPEPPAPPEPPATPKTVDDDDSGLNISINRNNRSHDNIIRMGMVDLGISTYVDGRNQLDLPDELSYMDQRLGRSYNIGIHIINVKKGFRKKDKPQHLGFSAGIKWNMVHYSLEKDYKVTRNADRFQDGIDYNVPALRYNRLKANHLQIPVLLEFNSNPNRPSKSLNIAAGIVFQALMNSNYKYKTETGEKTKIKGDFNMSKLSGLWEVRVGYGPLNFYAQVGPRVFQFLDGPYLKPINFGVNIIPR